MNPFDIGVPEAPPLHKPAPTPQEKLQPELGGSFDLLSTCRYCWGQHPGACPYLKIIEWHPTGKIARVVLKERRAHEALIVYPGDDQADLVHVSLVAIAAADTLERAQEIAQTLLKLIAPEEKPT